MKVCVCASGVQRTKQARTVYGGVGGEGGTGRRLDVSYRGIQNIRLGIPIEVIAAPKTGPRAALRAVRAGLAPAARPATVTLLGS